MRKASGVATRGELLREIATLQEELRAFREARLGSLRAVNELERTRDELELRVEERAAKLASSEGQLRTILESLADAVLVCDADGEIIHWNVAAETLCVVRPGLGAPLSSLMGPELGRRLSAAARDAIAEERSSRLGDAEINDGRGTTHLLDIVVSPTVGENAERRAVFVLRDVTEQRRLEMQVQHTARMDSLGQLSGGIAHDFNNMLNGIMGAAELLGIESSFPPGSPAADNLKLILDTAGQAAELTRKLLAFSRTDPQAAAIIDIHEPIRDAVAILHHSVDKRVEISMRLDAEQATIRGDKVQIQNALLNLGINANQAMARGGLLEIVTKSITLDAADCAAEPFALEPGPYVEILVRDTGIGMDETLRAKIFEPFFTTKELGRGTGLGLSMVYGTVESHGGAISVTSELGAHTTFRLLFPFHHAESKRPPAQTLAALTQALRVLVVDDERSVRRTLSAFFAMKGGEVLEASDGQAGLELIERHYAELDLVILDTVMPRISGADCLRRLRELAPSLPVVMISGHLRNVALRDLEDLGIGAFLSKPFRFAQLGQAVQQAMSGRELERDR